MIESFETPIIHNYEKKGVRPAGHDQLTLDKTCTPFIIVSQKTTHRLYLATKQPIL